MINNLHNRRTTNWAKWRTKEATGERIDVEEADKGHCETSKRVKTRLKIYQ